MPEMPEVETVKRIIEPQIKGQTIQDDTLTAEYLKAKLGKRKKTIKEIIAWGINANEMTPEEYLTGKGKEYSNIPNLRVYGREGLPCRKCGSAIKRIVIGGRSSCYCPICQRKHGEKEK